MAYEVVKVNQSIFPVAFDNISLGEISQVQSALVVKLSEKVEDLYPFLNNV